MFKRLTKKRSGIRWVSEITLVIVIGLLIGYSFYDFTKRVDGMIYQKAEESLTAMNRESALVLESQMERDFAFLKTEAALLVLDENYKDTEKLFRTLLVGQDNYSFDRMSFILPDGTAYTSGGMVENKADREYFKKAIAGEDTASSIARKDYYGSEGFELAIPVYNGDQIVGVLTGGYLRSSFDSVVNMSIYGGQSTTYVIQSNGVVVLEPKNSKIEKQNKHFEQSILGNMQRGESGFLPFNDGEEDWFFSYIPAPMNDWYILSFVPKSVVMMESDYINQLAMMLCAKITAALLMIGTYAFVSQRKRYRQEQKRQESLYLDASRYKILVENLKILFFEWDLYEKRVVCSVKWQEKLGYIPDLNLIETAGFVKDDERLSMEGFFEAVRGGLAYEKEEYRLLRADGSVFWCLVHLTGIKDKQGNVRRIMGLIDDIDVRKRREEELLNQSQRDSLTNLLNKRTTENQITFILDNDIRGDLFYGFLLLDIDDFKNINDSYGHNTGDVVLKNVSDKLVSVLRNTDIVGRIGGDEFMIFLRGTKSRENICTKAEDIINGLKTVFVAENYPITCSLGVVIVKECNRDFKILYTQADSAMYEAKKNGKNQYAFYEEN